MLPSTNPIYPSSAGWLKQHPFSSELEGLACKGEKRKKERGKKKNPQNLPCLQIIWLSTLEKYTNCGQIYNNKHKYLYKCNKLNFPVSLWNIKLINKWPHCYKIYFTILTVNKQQEDTLLNRIVSIGYLSVYFEGKFGVFMLNLY